jgi:Ca2+-binding RTX toxin-like protein
MFGTWRSEVFLGAEGNDRFRGGYGDDVIDGGAGIDTALYRYRYAEYSVRRLDGGDLEVAYTGRWHGDGTDRLAGVEQLEFVDRTIMVDDLVF